MSVQPSLSSVGTFFLIFVYSSSLSIIWDKKVWSIEYRKRVILTSQNLRSQSNNVFFEIFTVRHAALKPYRYTQVTSGNLQICLSRWFLWIFISKFYSIKVFASGWFIKVFWLVCKGMSSSSSSLENDACAA